MIINDLTILSVSFVVVLVSTSISPPKEINVPKLKTEEIILYPQETPLPNKEVINKSKDTELLSEDLLSLVKVKYHVK